ncbi:hypothetical protein [Streptomyces sp. NPDC048669]|uniref:VOC family protein n=1 Tax=Streptomyces sp. NPDC048669 TaxID=3155267 RepID=UPI00343528BD
MAVAAAEHVAPVLGLPCWVNLRVSDLNAARTFYSTVLGREFGESPLGDHYVVAPAHDGATFGFREGAALTWPPLPLLLERFG